MPKPLISVVQLQLIHIDLCEQISTNDINYETLHIIFAGIEILCLT